MAVVKQVTAQDGSEATRPGMALDWAELRATRPERTAMREKCMFAGLGLHEAVFCVFRVFVGVFNEREGSG